MKENLFKKIKDQKEKVKVNKRQKKVLTILGVFVVLFTAYTLMMPAITASKLTCTKEEHTHSIDCYEEKYICEEPESEEITSNPECYEKVLTCTKEEHSHTDSCYEEELSVTTETQSLIDLINTIPTVDELSQEMDVMYEEDKTSDEIESYYNSVISSAEKAYTKYQELSQEEQTKVTNYSKIQEYIDFELIGEKQKTTSTYVVRDGNKLTFDIFQQNTYYWDSGFNGHENTFGYTSSAKTLSDVIDKNDLGTVFYPFYVVVAKRQSDNTYRVSSKVTSLGGKEDTKIPANSIVFMTSQERNTADTNALKEVPIGAKVTLNLNNKSLTKTATNATKRVGTITFDKSTGVQKIQNDNTNKLHTIVGADTKELITVNLYDYNSKINDKYDNVSKYYPGFQQPGGTTEKQAESLEDDDNFNFGDTIAEEYGKKKINGTGAVGINAFNKDVVVNRPVEDTMKLTLGSDGYPALAYKDYSLKYLFTENEYATKENKTSINRLFQIDEKTGAYYYNSRDNHAQFNPSTDEFILYQEKISSNFIQYPFGNFLPLNDITKQTTQGNLITGSWYSKIIDSARYKANNSTGQLKAQYEQLYKSLINFEHTMTAKSTSYGYSYSAGTATREFFNQNNIPENPTAAELTEGLKNVYSIDYDEATNFFFGLEMKMNFMQPKNGLTGKDGKQPMEFYFTGDDDVWVYIDGVLFLDLSGIHRHVGGEIDFVNGKVYYYQLSKDTGDVSTTPYKTLTFKEILKEAGKTTTEINELLNSKGTFKNYSTHDFNFYYMERGSGSGVMRMNFNMPLIKDNSISIGKEMTDAEELIGNPDFNFQVMKPNLTQTTTDDELFVKSGTEYNLYDSSGNKINEHPLYVGSNGIITLKAGQHAIISGIAENSGKYYVRELLDKDWVEQYESVRVDGTTITVDSSNPEITVGKDTFSGIISPTKDISDGNTVFSFTNDVDPKKYGKLEITKTLDKELDEEVTESLKGKLFNFNVTIDGEKLPVGTKYTVGTTENTVTTAGVITIKAGEKAVIDKIIAGSKFNVQEQSSTTSGFLITYYIEGKKQETDYASGNILLDSDITIRINNQEQGVYIKIPVEKTTKNPDGIEYTYSFSLIEKLANSSIIISTKEIKVNSSGIGSNDQLFKLWYSQPEYDQETTTKNYQIVEVKKTKLEDITVENDIYTDYDTSVYDLEVTIKNKTGEPFDVSYKITKNGEELNKDDIKFENARLASLTLTKNVESKNPESKEVFNFEITSSDVEDGIYKTNTSEMVTFKDGKAAIDLVHQESLIIYGLPYGSKYSVKETNSEGYAVTYQVDTNSKQEGNEVTDIILNHKNTEINIDNPFGISYNTDVTFTNMKGYELPDTGSNIELILVIIGSLLLSSPIIYKGYSLYKGNKMMA